MELYSQNCGIGEDIELGIVYPVKLSLKCEGEKVILEILDSKSLLSTASL